MDKEKTNLWLDIDEIRRRNAVRIAQDKFGSNEFIARTARLMGKTVSQISQLLSSGNNNPKPIGKSLARHFENAFHREKFYLDNNHEVALNGGQNAEANGERYIPILPDSAIDLFVFDKAISPDALFFSDYPKVEESDRSFIYNITDDSMVDHIDIKKSVVRGDQILVDASQRATNGSIVLVRPSADYPCVLRIYEKIGNTEMLRPANPQYPTFTVGIDISIRGRAIQRITPLL